LENLTTFDKVTTKSGRLKKLKYGQVYICHKY